MEATTRENYVYTLNRYVLPELGDVRMAELLPDRVREWISILQSPKYKAKPPTIQKAKIVLDAILTTALNEQVTFFHAGRGVRTPPVATKPRRIITAEQYELIHEALKDDETMRLLVETDIESGLRWGELTELRLKDLDLVTGIVTISRAVVELKSRNRPDGKRFLVKDYPKDAEWRQLKLAPHLVSKIKDYAARRGLGPEDLLFEQPQPAKPRRRTLPDELPDPDTLGLTEPDEKGRRYKHGTTTAYGDGRCRCQPCKDAVAAYRAARRAAGKDDPRRPRTVNTDGHVSNVWFRNNVWNKALEAAGLGFRVTPHGLRHAHASWLLAGGADLQVVKERLGHGTITTTEKYLHSLPNAGDTALAALTVIRGNRTPKASAPPDAPAAATASETERRDAELAEMRELVAKLSQMLSSPSTSA
jgi:integrase